MKITESFTINAPRERVAELFTDVPALSTCVPGVTDVQQVADDEWKASLAVTVGPIKALFSGVAVTDFSQAPDLITADVRGDDARTGSKMDVKFTARLHDRGQTTQIDTEAELTIRGRLAQFGVGIMKATTRSMVEVFVGQVNDRLSPGDNQPLGETRVVTAPGAISVAALVRGWLQNAFAGLRARVKGSIRGR